MIIKAEFKGQDGSLGYKTGQEYTLRFHIDSDDKGDEFVLIQEITSQSHGGAVLRLRNDSFCPYSSLRKFLDNWEVLQ